ncbi:hypothetical protein HFD88_002744 [Aspergillus terreus]|nr:hypothetical protein HFD88_002744 [Aspergillus terreus]
MASATDLPVAIEGLTLQTTTESSRFPNCYPSLNPVDIYREHIADKLAEITGIDAAKIFDRLLWTDKLDKGDLVLPVPALGIKKNPQELCKELAEKFPESDLVERPTPVAIHLQFFFKPNTLTHTVIGRILEAKAAFGTNGNQGLRDPADPSKGKKKIIIEFSSPNIAKPFHAGHLRSTIIGGFLANLYTVMGWDVIKMNYLGDWGKQYGLLANGYKYFGNEEELLKDPINHLFNVYVKINNMVAEQDGPIKELKEQIKTKKEKNEDVSELQAQLDKLVDVSEDEKARRYFKSMEDGDQEALALWRRFRDLSIQKYRQTYARLNIDFDVYSGESQIRNESMTAAYKTMEKAGVSEKSDGAVIVDFTKHGAKKLGKAIIIRKDGTPLYLTRDIGAILERDEAYHFDKMIYVVAMQQDLHLAQLFKITELMGYKDLASRCQHVNFGMVRGMSTRKGTVKFLDDILQDVRDKMHEVMKKNTEKYEQVAEPEKTADILGITSVMVQDMTGKRINGYDFNLEAMTSFEGDTGPYLQYAHARLCSIVRKSGLDVTQLGSANLDILTEPHAVNLVRLLAQWPDVLMNTTRTLEPTTIITYLFRMTHMLSSSYDVLKVVGSEPEVKMARMALYESARLVLNSGMRILGLSPVERHSDESAFLGDQFHHRTTPDTKSGSAAPKILFLDEPTSGLDSTASYEVISYVKRLAVANNLIIIASIHQPSTTTFQLFDKLLLLSGGQTCYFGPVASVPSYFESIGCPIPASTNPAEFLLDSVSSDFTEAQGRVEQIKSAWAQRLSSTQSASSHTTDGKTGRIDMAELGRPNVLQITLSLLHRLFIKSYRDVVAYGIRIVMYMGLAIMMGTVWLRLHTSQDYIQPFINAIFFGSAFMSFMAVAYVPAFLEDRATFTKERANGLYGALPFIVSNFIIGLPFLFVISLLFSIVSYWLSNFRPSGTAFFTWVMWLFLDLLAAESLVVFVTSLFPNFVIALALVAFANGLWMSVGGFLVSPTILNPFWKYVFHYIDYQAYVFQGMMVNEFADRVYTCGDGCNCMYQTDLAGQCMIRGTGVLQAYGYATGRTGKWVGILIGIIAVYRLFGYLALVPETMNPSEPPPFPKQETPVILPDPSEFAEIHTERLTLRLLRVDNDEDAAGLFRIRSQPEVMNWMRLKAADTSVDDTKAWIRKKVLRPAGSAADASSSRLFYFAVVEKGRDGGSAGKKIVGAAGVNSIHPAPAVGCMFHPDVWGKGYATEAVRAVVAAWWELPRAWCGEEEKLFAAVKAANVGSLRVLEKVGFEVYAYTDSVERLALMAMRRPSG